MTNFDIALKDGEVVPPLKHGEGALGPPHSLSPWIKLTPTRCRLSLVRPGDQAGDARGALQRVAHDGQRCVRSPSLFLSRVPADTDDERRHPRPAHDPALSRARAGVRQLDVPVRRLPLSLSRARRRSKLTQSSSTAPSRSARTSCTPTRRTTRSRRPTRTSTGPCSSSRSSSRRTCASGASSRGARSPSSSVRPLCCDVRPVEPRGALADPAPERLAGVVQQVVKYEWAASVNQSRSRKARLLGVDFSLKRPWVTWCVRALARPARSSRC